MSGLADEIFAELTEVSRMLFEARGEERARLEEKRDELRERARLVHLAMSDPRTLATELAHARRRLAELEGERLQIPTWQRHVGGRLTDPAASGREINRRLDEATAPERAALESRVEVIAKLLGESED